VQFDEVLFKYTVTTWLDAKGVPVVLLWYCGFAKAGVWFGLGKGGLALCRAGKATPLGNTASTITISQLLGRALVDPITISPLLSTTAVAPGAG
jgi:hypothetical protein